MFKGLHDVVRCLQITLCGSESLCKAALTSFDLFQEFVRVEVVLLAHCADEFGQRIDAGFSVFLANRVEIMLKRNVPDKHTYVTRILSLAVKGFHHAPCSRCSLETCRVIPLGVTVSDDRPWNVESGEETRIHVEMCPMYRADA